jgi:hypothetical protein
MMKKDIITIIKYYQFEFCPLLITFTLTLLSKATYNKHVG